MFCKFHEVLAFVREFKLMDDMDDDAVKETFDLFPHACKWDKEIGIAEASCDELEVIIDKTLDILDESFEHEYTPAHIKQIATAFCDVFDAAGAPKRPVPFIILLLSRL